MVFFVYLLIPMSLNSFQMLQFQLFFKEFLVWQSPFHVSLLLCLLQSTSTGVGAYWHFFIRELFYFPCALPFWQRRGCVPLCWLQDELGALLTQVHKISSVDSPAGSFKDKRDIQMCLNEQEGMLTLWWIPPSPCTFWVSSGSNQSWEDSLDMDLCPRSSRGRCKQIFGVNWWKLRNWGYGWTGTY